MSNKHGWDKLLEDPFFQHIKTDSIPEDVNRLLKIIGEDIYPTIRSFSIEDDALAIPGDNAHKETIGSQTVRAMAQLENFRDNAGKTKLPSSESSKWLDCFLSDKKFQSYVFQLFSFLSNHAQASLTDSKDIPPMEDRAKAAARDNAEELEDEVGRAEAARESAERAQKAAEKPKKL